MDFHRSSLSGEALESQLQKFHVHIMHDTSSASAILDRISLRPATASDAAALATLGRESFCAAFEHLYRPQDLASFLEEAYAIQAVAGEIADDSHIHCLAVEGERLLGYCKLRHPSSYSEYSSASNPIALGQLYTQPDMTGKGVGAALMEWALAEARQRGCDAVQLSVYAENYGAHRFYQRYGFAKIADITFKVGEQLDPEFLYELRLDRGETA